MEFVTYADLKRIIDEELTEFTEHGLLMDIYTLIAREKLSHRIHGNFTRWKYSLQRKIWHDERRRQLHLFNEN